METSTGYFATTYEGTKDEKHQITKAWHRAREVKEMFHFRMAIQPTYGGALKGIGHTRSRRFLVVIFKWGKNKDYVFVVTAYPAKRAHVEVYLRTVGGIQ